MSAETILPDTCAWIDYFNGRDTTMTRSLAHALTTCEIVTCGVVIFELFQGIRSNKEYDLLRNAFSSLRYIEMDRSLWLSAAQIAASLRKKGVTLPSSDIQIASLALQHNLIILTVDQHFRHVPDLVMKEAL
jgi:predicted nucleic acid-binding protein